MTDLGKIYRGPADDGAFATWAFTRTSAFDDQSGINAHFGNKANLPIAAFKFMNLRLDTDPVISTANGGATKLALISVGPITSGNTRASFTFGALDTVVLATQSGSITLNNISFQDIGQLYFYARGRGSNLTLGASVIGVQDEILQAQGDVQVNAPQSSGNFHVLAGNDYLAGTGPITAGTLDINTGRNLNFTTAQYPYGDSFGQSVVLNAGNAVNIDARGDTSVFDSAGFIDVRGITINVDSDAFSETSFFFRPEASVLFTAGVGGFNSPNVAFNHPGNLLSISSDGDISIALLQGGDALNAAGTYMSRFGTSTKSLVAGTIDVGADLSASEFISAGTTIDVVGQLSALSVVAGGDVTAGGVSVRNLSTPTGLLTAGLNGITPYVNGAGSNVLHTLTAASVRSSGGINFSGSQFPEPAGAGGQLTINTNSLFFGPGGDIEGPINFNGADATISTPAGDGGIFNVNAAQAIVVSTDIEATTGFQGENEPPTGAGGTVNLTSSQGGIAVDSRIEVSSADPLSDSSPAPPRRRSNSGGNITLTSGATRAAPSKPAVAINITNTSQLLSLLDNAATGPGGKITILATGDRSSINVNGSGQTDTIRADKGTVDIRHTGGNGNISINNAAVRGDVVKVGAFGANGSLIVGGGQLTADTVLKLYAPGSNGTINFIADCTLTAGSQSVIAAGTVSIANNVIVTIGGAKPADVYTGFTNGTPNANYTGYGGNGTTTGTFAGAGANPPLPLADRPAFDGGP
ncbi:MAG: hypothetical protein H0V25_01465 [Solirubrobacterales bacterium]|nr:hypothetical protein [Solirubrobacterales bacterium]